MMKNSFTFLMVASLTATFEFSMNSQSTFAAATVTPQQGNVLKRTLQKAKPATEDNVMHQEAPEGIGSYFSKKKPEEEKKPDTSNQVSKTAGEASCYKYLNKLFTGKLPNASFKSFSDVLGYESIGPNQFYKVNYVDSDKSKSVRKKSGVELFFDGTYYKGKSQRETRHGKGTDALRFKLESEDGEIYYKVNRTGGLEQVDRSLFPDKWDAQMISEMKSASFVEGKSGKRFDENRQMIDQMKAWVDIIGNSEKVSNELRKELFDSDKLSDEDSGNMCMCADVFPNFQIPPDGNIDGDLIDFSTGRCQAPAPDVVEEPNTTQMNGRTTIKGSIGCKKCLDVTAARRSTGQGACTEKDLSILEEGNDLFCPSEDNDNKFVNVPALLTKYKGALQTKNPNCVSHFMAAGLIDSLNLLDAFQLGEFKSDENDDVRRAYFAAAILDQMMNSCRSDAVVGDSTYAKEVEGVISELTARNMYANVSTEKDAQESQDQYNWYCGAVTSADPAYMTFGTKRSNGDAKLLKDSGPARSKSGGGGGGGGSYSSDRVSSGLSAKDACLGRLGKDKKSGERYTNSDAKYDGGRCTFLEPKDKRYHTFTLPKDCNNDEFLPNIGFAMYKFKTLCRNLAKDEAETKAKSATRLRETPPIDFTGIQCIKGAGTIMMNVDSPRYKKNGIVANSQADLVRELDLVAKSACVPKDSDPLVPESFYRKPAADGDKKADEKKADEAKPADPATPAPAPTPPPAWWEFWK